MYQKSLSFSINKYGEENKRLFFEKYEEKIIYAVDLMLESGSSYVSNTEVVITENFLRINFKIEIDFDDAINIYSEKKEDKDLLFRTLIGKGPRFKKYCFSEIDESLISDFSKIRTMSSVPLDKIEFDKLNNVKNKVLENESAKDIICRFIIHISSENNYRSEYLDDIFGNLKKYTADEVIRTVQDSRILFNNILGEKI